MKDQEKGSGAELTSKQQQIYDYIKEFINEKHYSPSVRDICVGVGLSSTSTVHSHLKRLEKKGLISRGGNKSRSITLINEEPPEKTEPISAPQLAPETDFCFGNSAQANIISLPVIGDVAAGSPILAEQNITDTFSLPTAIVGDNASFLLNVHGESMIDIGINDGDYVVVKEQKVANNGDIVVAIVEDGATVKRFFKEDGYFRLQPENKTMDPIIVNEVTIAGKVVALFRSLR